MASAVVRRLSAWDRTAYAACAARPAPFLDAVLPLLSRSADHGGLWAGAALGMAATGRPALRRGAWRGTLAITIASPLANIAGKKAFRRERPQYGAVPLSRLVKRWPRTTSFPSGHSASAAAYATGVALDAPLAALPVGAVALAVIYSRVHIGVHYPLDVVAGSLIGVASALVTTAFLPRAGGAGVETGWRARPGPTRRT